MDHYSLEPANFTDYRDFLRSRVQMLQLENKSFSLQACATRSKVSKSLLQFLFQKKRHLGLDKLPNLAKSLKLNTDEEYFVCLMLCKCSSRNPVIQSHFEKILDRIRNQYIKVESARPVLSQNSEKKLYLNSMLMILQDFLRLKGFQEDAGWIAENLNLSGVEPDYIAEMLVELQKLPSIKRDAEGRLVANEESLWQPDPYDPSGQSVFTAAAEAVAQMMKTPAVYKPSVYMSMALAFDEEQLMAAEKFMIEVHHELSRLAAISVGPTAIAYVGNFFLTVARLTKFPLSGQLSKP